MTAQRSVVVTDVTTPNRFLACLTAVHRSVARDVEVVGISASFPKLPPQLERRVRKVRVAKGASLSDAVSAEAVRPLQVVVVTSDTRVSGDWLAQLERMTAPTPYCVGIVGGDQPRVLVFGDRVRTTQAQDVPLPDVPGISWAGSRREAGSAPAAGVRQEPTAAPVTVSAALIVKDEEAVLAQCLDALVPEVDEVVVYDTGSTDGTVALARAHGARVVEGYWDDDFAAARNRLLEHVSTEWVLSVDADEVLQSEPGALRQRLTGERADLLLVPVVSTTWSAGDDGQEHWPARIFRRDRAQWTDPLHETLVPRGGGDLVLASQPAPLRLIHSGYHLDRMKDKDKHARNLEIARAHVEALPDSVGDIQAARAWANYGRALTSAGQSEAGLDALSRLLDLRGNRSEMVMGARAAMQVALSLSRLEDVDRWLEIARLHGETEGQLGAWRAQLLLHHGDLDGAQAELDEAVASTGVDPWGKPFDPDALVGARADLLTRRGQHAEALGVLVDLLHRRQESVPLALLMQVGINAGRSLGELAAIGGTQFVARSVRDVMHLPPAAADQWLDAVYHIDPQPGVLVAGSLVAAHLPMDAVLRWSLRVREVGAADLCPLRAIGYDVERAVAERCLALAVLGDVLGEADALAEFDDVAAGLPDDQTDRLLAALATYAPGLAVESTDQVVAV